VIEGANGVFGVIGVAHTSRAPFTGDALALLHGVAGVLAAAIDRLHTDVTMARRALHDPVTGLPNRTLLLDRIAQALGRHRRNGRQLGLVLVDLDRFSAVNELRGHDVGDEVLRVVAKRLSAALRVGDTIAHLGGDEFAVLADPIDTVHESVEIARRLLGSVGDAIAIDGVDVLLTASVGIAVDGNDWRSALEALRDADTALHWAKTHGGGRFEIYDAAMREQARQRLHLESDLRRALLAGELDAWFQPQIEISSGSAVGAEALLRWTHPTRGHLSPEEFLHVAADGGLLELIDERTVEQALWALAAWSGQPGLPASVSVNLGARHLVSRDLERFVARALERAGVAANRLCIEVTEHTLLDDVDAARAALEALHRLGVRISLDDFGTGYSSLHHITRLPIDEVKIDRSFVRHIHEDAGARAVVSAVVAMAHALDVRVLAEGIESSEQLAVVTDLGCDAAQGYLWAPALPEPELVSWLLARPVPSDAA
jgi:diguanylate cyclase (GGDEF)-like protein